jgi:hypothetical protein
MDNKELRLNEALAMMDMMAERLTFSTRFIIRLQEDAGTQQSLNEDLLEEYDRMVSLWADQDDETKEL